MRTGFTSAARIGWLGALIGGLAVAAGAAVPPITAPGSHVFVVATSAHSPGAAGSNWVTDLVIHNPGAAATAANVYFLERGADNSSAPGIAVTVPPDGSLRLPDVVLQTFGHDRSSGALLIGSDGQLVVTSRTFNNASTGTFGQFVEGYPVQETVTTGERVRLLELTKNASFRTNIGVANATASATLVQVELYRADGSAIGTRALSVPPFGFAQDDDTFAKAGASVVDDGYAVVSSATPGARYFTYASVIDSRTNDPICVVPVGRTGAASQSAFRPSSEPGSGFPGRSSDQSQASRTVHLGPRPSAGPAPTDTALPLLISAGQAPAGGALGLQASAAPLAADSSTPPPPATVVHLAGTTGGPGYSDGTGSSARFAFPSGIVADLNGTMVIADTANHTLRRLTAGGTSSTLAGLAGYPGTANGSGSSARFSNPCGVTMDLAGNLYVADTSNHAIRKVTASGQVTTLAGQPGSPGSTNGTGSSARFRTPAAIVMDTVNGVLFVADTGNNTVRRVTLGGAVTTLAGLAGTSGSTDGLGSDARFSSPAGIATDGIGNIWVADTGNHTIRRVTQGGFASTVAGVAGSAGSSDGMGTAARFNLPAGLAADGGGGAWVTEIGGCTVRRVSSAGVVSTVAGTAGQPGASDGYSTAASFTSPTGVATTPLGYVLVADTDNHTIRKVTTTGNVSTLAGMAPTPGATDSSAAAARFDGPADVATDKDGNVFVADLFNNTIRRISASGSVSTLAGRAGEAGADNGTGGSARFSKPSGLAIDPSGTLYVTDRGNHTIRKVTSGGSVTTLAGRPGYSGSADAPVGSGARFSSPDGLAVTGSGGLVVADTGNCTIRSIAASGAVTTLAGKAGSCAATDGTGSAARFSHPSGVAVDAAGTVFVADTDNHVIRRVTSAGVASTLAGKAGTPGGADGTGNAARFTSPTGIALGAGGVLWVVEQQGTVRKVTADGVVTTLAGLAGTFGSEDGPGTSARFNVPLGIAVAGSDSLVVADYDNNAVRLVTVTGCELALSITATPTSGRAPLQVQFTGLATPFGSSCGTPSWSWSFGDGSPASSATSPTHTYTAGGNFAWTGAVSTAGASVSKGGTISVEPPCTAPAAPTLTAPSIATGGYSYPLAWTATSPDNTYSLEESTDPAFADATEVPVTGTDATTSHQVTAATTWYARVRATASCGGQSLASAWSAATATSVVPGPAPGSVVYLPAAAHVPGLAGTNWVTDLELHNPGTVPAAFSLDLLKSSTDNSHPRTTPFTLEPGTSRRLADVLWSADAAFAFPGSGTLRITPTSGTVMATQRTYNDQPSGTYGQFIPGLEAGRAIQTGQEARLVQLSQSADLASGFRSNLGLASASNEEITIVFTLHRDDGTSLGEQTRTLPPYGYIQIANVFNLVSTVGVTEGFIVLHTTTAGAAFFAYASVVDNRSGDPIYIPARVVPAS